MAALHMKKEDFEEIVLKGKGTVLVDFWAAWCGPCKMLAPIIDELAEEFTNAKICKVNVDELPELAEKFNIMTIPTLLVFRDGEVVNSSIGVIPKAKILELLGV